MGVARVRVDGRPTKERGIDSLLPRVLPIDGDALDVGTGTGRIALAVAPHVRHVIGVDVDASSLEAARWAQRRASFENVRFVEADAETADLAALNDGQGFHLATARLFFGFPLVANVARALAPRGHFLIEALEAHHWSEAGGSRFNVAADEAVAALERSGLEIAEARVEETVQELADADAAQGALNDRRLWTKWRQDGRWDRLRATLRRGKGTLTDSHLVAWARRPA